MEFNRGEFVCFIGTSGSGKTTLMRMLNRMLEPTSGELTIDGKNIKDFNEVELRRKIGYVIQQIGLMPHMTIYENITMVPRLLKWPENKMKEKAVKLIKMVDLPESFLNRYPSELSGGQQQRVFLARALVQDAEIYFMDEPFQGVDSKTEKSIINILKKLRDEKKTVIVVHHDLQTVKDYFDYVTFINVSVVASGPVEEIFTPENIEKTYKSKKTVQNSVKED